ncbi:PIG-L deacetylase family protein, partial [Actinoallomurus acaciae]
RLGAEWRTLDLPDGFVPADDEVALRLCDVIREVRPDAVVAHWSGSWHKDHRAAHTLAVNAAFFAALPTLRRDLPAHDTGTLLFGENWEDDEGFRPERLFDVTDGVPAWREAVREYELARGLASFPYYDYYSSLYRLRGCTSGCRYAQAYRMQSGQSMAGVGQFLRRSGDEAAR